MREKKTKGDFGRKTKTKPLRLGLGMPSGMAPVGDGGRWWCGAFANREAEEGFGAENLKPSIHGSVLGTLWETALEGDRGRWWGGAFANHEVEEGFGAKTQNRVFVAWFRVHHGKRWCGVVLGGGGCGSMS
jgi:hypothetical protein